MSELVELRVVIMVAAAIVIVSLILTSFAGAEKEHRREKTAFLWLGATNVAFLAAVAGLLAGPWLPFGLAAVLVILGMLTGMLIGFVALSHGVGDRPDARVWLGLGLGIGAAQGVVAILFQSVEMLAMTSSVINGSLGLILGGRLWQRSRDYGVSLALLASAPFVTIGLAYLGRLWVIAADKGAYALAVATLAIMLTMAFSSLQWSFALAGFHAARLNRTLAAARDRAEAASVLKSRLLANMSHELRTPLNGILGMAQGLEDVVRDSPGKDMLATMSESAQALLRRLTDVLDLSDLQSGRLELARDPFDLTALLAATLAPLAEQARAKGLAFGMDVRTEGTGWYLGDGPRIGQLVAKLAENAVGFTAQGRIDIRVRMLPASVRIACVDTGIGMTPEQQARAFDAFMQADISVTRRHDGAGMGLPIARALVQAMGGRLELASAPLQGSQFDIDLPLVQTEAPIPAPAPAPPVPTPERPLAILAAEDNKANQRVLVALLKDLAADLSIADNGQIAVDRAKAHDFDLFLFDIMMPEMDGLTALRRIRDDYSRTGRPVPRAVAVTANVSPEQVRDYRSAGFDDVLAKPIRKAQLLASCARHPPPPRGDANCA